MFLSKVNFHRKQIIGFKQTVVLNKGLFLTNIVLMVFISSISLWCSSIIIAGEPSCLLRFKNIFNNLGTITAKALWALFWFYNRKVTQNSKWTYVVCECKLLESLCWTLEDVSVRVFRERVACHSDGSSDSVQPRVQ